VTIAHHPEDHAQRVTLLHHLSERITHRTTSLDPAIRLLPVSEHVRSKSAANPPMRPVSSGAPNKWDRVAQTTGPVAPKGLASNA
jgi:hypothetical protein